MDYTNVLNDIDYLLYEILDVLQNFNFDELLTTLLMFFVIFLLLYILRGE